MNKKMPREKFESSISCHDMITLPHKIQRFKAKSLMFMESPYKMAVATDISAQKKKVLTSCISYGTSRKSNSQFE